MSYIVKSQPWPNWVERALHWIIWLNIFAYLTELGISENSRVGPAFFLWLERTIAMIFTLELFVRSHHAVRTQGWGYFKAMFWVDLVSVVPFWVGFFVPPQHLDVIRSMRVLRMMKLYRYNDQIQVLVVAFGRCAGALKNAAVCLFIISLFAASLLHIVEKDGQPETFGQ